jgi:hypothetical protein
LHIPDPGLSKYTLWQKMAGTTTSMEEKAKNNDHQSSKTAGLDDDSAGSKEPHEAAVGQTARNKQVPRGLFGAATEITALSENCETTKPGKTQNTDDESTSRSPTRSKGR